MEALTIDQFTTVEDLESRLKEVKSRLAGLDSEFGVKGFTDEARSEWNDLNDQHDAIEARLDEIDKRKKRLADIAGDSERVVPAEDTSRTVYQKKGGWTWDVSEIRLASRNEDDLAQRLRDNALHAVEQERFTEVASRGVKREDVQEHIRHLLDTVDNPTGEEGVKGELARRILATGSPIYRRAFHKHLAGAPMTPEEQRALVQSSTGAYPIVYALDPTIIPISNSVVNPWRALARIVQVTGTNNWKAVASLAITAAYATEGTEAGDNTPTLTQPAVPILKAQAFVPFSFEVGQDWGAVDEEMARLFADAKDDLEGAKFALGTGTAEPTGVIVGATNTVGTTTTAAFVIADLYKLYEALAPRFRPRASFAGSMFILDKIRQFDTAGGSGVWMGPNSFGLQGSNNTGDFGTVYSGVRSPLLGRPVYEASAMASALTTTSKILIVGDFSKFVIVDRIGMDIELVPQLFGTAGRPTGQKGLYASWRNGSNVMAAAPFQVLVT